MRPLFFSGHVAGVSSILMTMTMASCRLSFLVGAFKHFFNFRQGVAYIYIYGIILPIDELIFFKMVIAPPTSFKSVASQSLLNFWNTATESAKVSLNSCGSEPS